MSYSKFKVKNGKVRSYDWQETVGDQIKNKTLLRRVLKLMAKKAMRREKKKAIKNGLKETYYD